MLTRDDLLTAEAVQDPYAYFGHLREEEGVAWNARWGGWLVTRYDDVLQVLRDPEHFSSDRMAALRQELTEGEEEKLALLINHLSKWFVFSDPPYHTRLRMLVNKAFTPSSVERLRPRVRQIVEGLLDGLAPRRQMEFIKEFAFHIPVIVICEYMGVPAEDREKLKVWSNQVGSAVGIRAGDPERWERSQQAVERLLEYFQPLVEERRRHPREDFITALVQAEERGDLLSDEEVLATCTLLMFAGHESTMNLLANGLAAFMRFPDQWELLCREPGLVRPAVEELLRYDGPVKALTRQVRGEVTLGGKELKEGDRLMLLFAAANRDPRKFRDPERLDIIRSPNPHLGFGYGIHVCLGAPLARLEAQETFLALSRRLPGIRLAIGLDELEYYPTFVGRILKKLPVEW